MANRCEKLLRSNNTVSGCLIYSLRSTVYTTLHNDTTLQQTQSPPAPASSTYIPGTGTAPLTVDVAGGSYCSITVCPVCKRTSKTTDHVASDKDNTIKYITLFTFAFALTVAHHCHSYSENQPSISSFKNSYSTYCNYPSPFAATVALSVYIPCSISIYIICKCYNSGRW